ncbi:XRN 5'-3' exonuclease [Teladorsagia circumcincta]|uniref:5'-3' exoribonuclease n=1 Tax=Teladorsagia circumcincta TaxID=45464 RepID=A0A2G9V3L3_TELCI|nr:XRN 5'-3' exonuclease [Teladorsagia circumcincta]
MNGIIHPCTHPEDRPAPANEDEMFMNQQRSRRFRASKEAWEKNESIEEVILSDANAPGEGEHKIMDFIRKQRANPAHNPDTVHCLCGADADLIMLGLATHEANFNIIREEFIPNQQRPCDLCGQYGHELKECRGLENEEKGPEHADPISKEKNFIFLRIPVLREYLEREMAMENLPFKYDFERVIDDWVFLCFFVGNDFLPHLPSLEIREGAIDRLIKLYKDMVYTMKGYLTKDGNVYMDRVERIMLGLGEVEDEIFKRRQQDEERFKAIQKAKKARLSGGRPQAPSYVPRAGSLIAPLAKATPLTGEATRALAATDRKEAMQFAENEEAARRMKLMLKEEGTNSKTNQDSRKRPAEAPLDLSDEEPKDDIRLFEAGWKDRYYRRKVAWAYVEGLCWGCVSWDWYFPYHYAPFASDFDTVSQFKPDFSRPTKPFKPLEQLMSVFPAASKQHLPLHWQKLMTDEDSPIIDLYPIDFRIDLNGKKFAWQGVALLPFVDEVRANSIDIDPAFTYGVSGRITADETALAPDLPFPSPVNDKSCPDLPVNGAMMVIYEDPQYPEGFIFPAKRLENAKEIPRVLRDFNDRRGGSDYRPQIGFTRDVPGRASLDGSAHRFVQHNVRADNRSYG